MCLTAANEGGRQTPILESSLAHSLIDIYLYVGYSHLQTLQTPFKGQRIKRTSASYNVSRLASLALLPGIHEHLLAFRQGPSVMDCKTMAPQMS